MAALTYVLTHPGFRAVKVGHTTDRSRRLEQFGRRGWEPYRSLFIETPDLARQIEQAALFDIRYRLHVPPYLTATEMRNGGWSETFSLGLITAPEIWNIVCDQAATALLGPVVKRAPDGRRFNGGTPPRRVAGDTQPYTAAAKREASREQTSKTAQSGK